MFSPLPCLFLYPGFTLYLELIPGSSFGFCFALLKAAAPKSIPEAGRELAELVERLVDIVRSLQNQRHLPESGPQNKLNVLGMVGSVGRGKGVAGGRGGNSSQRGQREHIFR